MISHAGEQVAGGLVGLRKRHSIRLGELVQQVGAGQVLVAEHSDSAAMGEARCIDAAIQTVAGSDGLLRRAVLGVGVARGAPKAITLLGDEVCIAIHRKRIALALAVGVVCEGAISGAVFYI